MRKWAQPDVQKKQETENRDEFKGFEASNQEMTLFFFFFKRVELTFYMQIWIRKSHLYPNEGVKLLGVLISHWAFGLL